MIFSKSRFSKPLFLFFLSFLVYFFSWFVVYKTGINDTLIQSEDTLPAFFLPASLVLEGDFDLDEYFDLLVSRYPQPDGGRVPYYLEEVNGHFYSAFTVVPSLLAVPVYFLPLRLGLPVNFETIGLLGHISVALVVAASVAVVYLVFRLLAINNQQSTILSLVYAFGTCSFGLSSQAMWQHGASQLMFVLALYSLVRGLREPGKAAWAGLFLSLATLSRPTGAVVVVIISVYFLLKYGWRLWAQYVALGLIPLILFLITPGAAVGVLAGYGEQVGSSWTAPFPGAWLGLWFSPSKGVLTYSPVFLFSFLGIWILAKNKLPRKNSKSEALNPKQFQMTKTQNSKRFEHLKIWILDLFRISNLGFRICRRVVVSSESALFYWIFACVIVHSLVVGKWYSWYGGWAFGYRMMTDMLPFLAFLWIPFVQSPYWEKLKKWFYVAAVWSFGIQLAGIGFYDGVWHNLYDDGSQMGWLWSLRNCEMMYYLRRIVGKLTGVPANQIQ